MAFKLIQNTYRNTHQNKRAATTALVLIAITLGIPASNRSVTSSVISSASSSAKEIRLTDPAKFPKVESQPASEAAEMSVEKPLELYPEFQKIWSIKTARRPSSPAIVISEPESQHGLLLVGTSEGAAEAYDLISGKLRWAVLKSQAIESAPVVWGNDRVFIGGGPSLTVIETSTGTPLWQLELPGDLKAAPSFSGEASAASSRSTDDLDDDAAFFGTGAAGLFAVSPLTGRILWRQPIGPLNSTPLVRRATQNGTPEIWAFVDAENNPSKSRLLRLEMNSGDWKGSIDLDGAPEGSPLAVQGSIFSTTRTADGHSWLHKVNSDCPSDGACVLVWSKSLEGQALRGIAALPSAGLIYATLATGQILALRATDGRVAWRVDLGGPIAAAAAVTSLIPLEAREPGPGKRKKLGSLLAAIQSQGKVFLLDPFTGKTLKRFETGKGSVTPPVFADDRVFIVSPREISAYGGLSKFARPLPKNQGM